MFAIFIAGMIGVKVLGLHYRDIFLNVEKKQIKWGFLAYFASFILAAASAFLLTALKVPTSGNPITDEFTGDFLTIILRLLTTLPQLLGEELLTILPFLMLLRLLTSYSISEKKAGILALIVTSIGFGLLHLPTYNWNLLQCLLIISLARIPFTLVYMKTKNIYISWLSHVLYDWTVFIVAILTALVMH
ncbi:CPBP family intramembrane glutamic endopeptidase [Carnobacterium gallinarum]|uniref:CPBP family intramembrane glutamic endopeptidase n=1 Tax=Carnobacterium gallinarum TaxID=2749 RepID=UPI0014700ED6|nr:CPBP family intramembrane glutamic endopeptidase [Carnobacterium gallinarum]